MKMMGVFWHPCNGFIVSDRFFVFKNAAEVT